MTEIALDCALWRTDFGRGNLLVIRQTMELIISGAKMEKNELSGACSAYD